MIKMKNSFYTAIMCIILFFLFNVDTALCKSANPIKIIEIPKLKNMIKKNQNGFFMVVMAAWCGPCIRELPDLVYLYDKYRNQGFKIIAICVDYDGPESMQPVIDKHKVPFPVYWVGEKAIDEFSIFKIPMLMVIRQKSISERIIGKKSRKVIEKRIVEFLKERKAKIMQ